MNNTINCVLIGKLQNSEWITFIVIFKRAFDVFLFYSIIYLLIKVYICSTNILTFNLSHEVA